jgi:hypothetical protein
MNHDSMIMISSLFGHCPVFVVWRRIIIQAARHRSDIGTPPTSFDLHGRAQAATRRRGAVGENQMDETCHWEL